MTEEYTASLLYPKGADPSPRFILHPRDLKALLGNYLYSREFDLCDYLTDDPDTIVYRQELFADLLETPALEQLLGELLPLLMNTDELYRLRENSHDTEGQLYAIKLIEQYLTLIDTAHQGFTRLKERIRSQSLRVLAEAMEKVATDPSYLALTENTKHLSKEVTRVKCVTVGMNLDETFSPFEFGVLSFHSEYMQTGSLMDRLFRQGESTPLSPVSPLKNTSKALNKEEKRFADMAVSSVLNRLFKSVISDWEPAVKAFFRQYTKQFLPLIKEIKYVLFGTGLLRELQSKGAPLSVPTIYPKEKRSSASKACIILYCR